MMVIYYKISPNRKKKVYSDDELFKARAIAKSELEEFEKDKEMFL